MLDPPWPRTISEIKLLVIRGGPKACITDFFRKVVALSGELRKSEDISGELTIIRLHILTGKKPLETNSMIFQVPRGSDCPPGNCAWIWAMGMNRV
jgi:hypothetical protein